MIRVAIIYSRTQDGRIPQEKHQRGTYGDFSKVVEEIQELQDAHEQSAKIMVLCELADLYGAIEAYVWKHYKLTMKDINLMSELTKKAFEDGTRISKQD
ncbi:hypothetical protein LCGC14_0469500 [marine sediment metagenome]|uniref:NTP pyrophosphohydrolase MazG putative catalytic core domain-containing protein n=1 Tax=marine sediment metagenome TaxID=412755 RepID=A0A0F9SCL4_9ZZZZ